MTSVPIRAVKSATRTRLRLALVATACAVVASIQAAVPADAAQPFRTAVTDGTMFEDQPDVAFARAREAGASSVRIFANWAVAAPEGETKPEGFDARDHLDPNYRWGGLDRQVTKAVAAGLDPILMIFHVPPWAERKSEGSAGTRKPDPAELGDFAEAVATRYSGTVPGFPRIRNWQLWNEPNLYRYLMPQYDAPFDKNMDPANLPPALSPGVYRRMLKRFSRAIHGVHQDNLVVAGGLAPFGRTFANRHAVPPLHFMRELLCLTAQNEPRDGCRPLRFDVWAHHPYTEGGPNHSSANPENVSLGDLPEMRRVLDAAVRAGSVSSRRRVQFWVTEFSWETKPGDPYGVPMKLHSRWVAEAFYRMWRQGVTLVTWFKLRDDPVPRSDGLKVDCGLYFFCSEDGSCDQPKRSHTAFRFPFVAFRAGRKVKVWGRTPHSVRTSVVIEQKKRSGWRRLETLRTTRYGVFRARIRRSGRGPVRARVRNPDRAKSLPFALKRTRDMPVRIFGDEPAPPPA